MKKSIIVIVLVVMAAVAGMAGSMVGLSNTVGELAVEMGRVQVDAAADESLAYSDINSGTKLNNDEAEIIRALHANQDSDESAIEMSFSNMLVKVSNAIVASKEKNNAASDDDATVAYDPSDSAYTAPLGESVTYTPNRSRMILNSVVALASIMGVLAVMVAISISVGLRYWQRHRSQE